jgi:transposase-like protein
VILDGAQALHKATRAVFGEAALIQRCQVHKLRNILDHLPERQRPWVQPWNHKRVHRVYCALRLHLPRRTTRRLPKRIRQPLTAPPVLNQTWALDFMSETSTTGGGSVC